MRVRTCILAAGLLAQIAAGGPQPLPAPEAPEEEAGPISVTEATFDVAAWSVVVNGLPCG